MNAYLRTVIIAPITSKIKDYPSRIVFERNSVKNSIILDQIRTIDKARIVKKNGKLPKKVIEKLKDTLKTMLID